MLSKTKNSTSNNKEYSSASSYTSTSSDEEVDARDLKPIRDYLSDRKELAQQLFKSVKSEKIRLMLPQALKHMDLSELEEWCESELNGMSKVRILSILNGKPMLESSDTNESSDDSGPSLEIISDTEEWLTDDDTAKNENGGKRKLKRDKTKIKGKTQINKRNNSNKSNVKTKCIIKRENTTDDVKIKKEEDKDKGKEGDSLLDLLELEMRARAIRALIRKEEDIIPSINPLQTNDSQTIENSIGTSQDEKAKENCRKQLERIIGSQQSNKSEEEDVVLVIPKPAPVVELLSSDSGGEETRVNQEKNEHALRTGKSAGNLDGNSVKTISQELKERKETQEMHCNITKTHLTNTSEAIMPERNVDIKNNVLSISISADNVAERRKKSKKKSRGKSQLVSTVTNSSESKQSNIIEITKKSNNKNIEAKLRVNPSDENIIIVEEENKTEQKIAEENKVEEERSTDIDDIDLDDYCEVMEIENSDEDKSQDKVIVLSEQENKQSASEIALSKSNSTETWASRYYQTDDVQNVIKESKIQSEIRKRLRERQRLSKLNKSPNLNSPAQPSATDTTSFEKAPTGSVEEYLALKRALNANVSNINDTATQVQCTSDINNTIKEIQSTSDNNTTMEVECTSDIHNITIENNSTVTNSSNDSKAKEILVQDENISSHQECTDADTEKTVISKAISVSNLSEIVADTKDDLPKDEIPKDET
ncbi:calponin homology domain-containing protein DDB_G0272472 [Solenopsis invicta]|uniref:calponin homology domain-containing protein DDB_G0272472 n=1 Tax=Solenopsis invicta TaxID=13686 RepID=UPI00193DA446|nr:calponin homology domain-containing protein DDB_G0272472 [Solenopsis invicta]